MNHLGADMAFAAATEHTIVDRQSRDSGDTAWVLTRSETRGTFRDKPIHSRNVETMLLRRTGHEWKIVHIHWSSRQLTASSM